MQCGSVIPGERAEKLTANLLDNDLPASTFCLASRQSVTISGIFVYQMSNKSDQIVIRECTTLDELAACVQLQRDVFKLPEIEISPVRHLIVTRNAGGFTLGAFDGEEPIGFVLSVPAYLQGERAFYSHMTAVRSDHQGSGVGGRLKWAQRERSLAEGVKFIKWTFEPTKARNAFFNLEKLGAVVREMQENFYGVDYATTPEIGLASDRLFAQWELESDKVKALAAGENYTERRPVVRSVTVPTDWYGLVASNAESALSEQIRIREEFHSGFAAGLVCRGFERSETEPKYLLYKD
jgi:predicted GNAT superfamily acetyltransferase